MWSEEITRKIQTTAESLLREGKVDLVIGYQTGSTPLRTAPSFIRSADQTSLLVWNPFCENNLSVYLEGKEGKVGLLAKGCDARSAVVALQEKRIDRERLVIIGLPCSGVVDRKKLASEVDIDKVTAFSIKDNVLVLKAPEEVRVPLGDVIHASCKTCVRRNAPISDVAIEPKSPEPKIDDEFAEVRSFEALSSQDRWRYFSELAQKCIRCYACRNACPLCYCRECIVDQTQPQWFGKTTAQEDTMIYHLIRAFHVAGRCVDCGACSRACPMGLDLRFLNKKLQKDMYELYQYIPGLNPDEQPALGTYRVDDPQHCITEK
ncbi:MAG: Coenzyme F420 hydrogenase/dehydrogenase, beta subunit C-terminal domain [bacterium]